MTQIYFALEAFKSHVRVKGGRYFCIFSAYNPSLEEFETCIYPCDIEGNITSHVDVYKTWYSTRKEMIEGHKSIMTSPSDYLEGVI